MLSRDARQAGCTEPASLGGALPSGGSGARKTAAGVRDDDEGEYEEGDAPMGGPDASSYDATDDIQDIDRRLNALQQFLVAAKAPR